MNGRLPKWNSIVYTCRLHIGRGRRIQLQTACSHRYCVPIVRWPWLSHTSARIFHFRIVYNSLHQYLVNVDANSFLTGTNSTYEIGEILPLFLFNLRSGVAYSYLHISLHFVLYRRSVKNGNIFGAKTIMTNHPFDLSLSPWGIKYPRII